MCVCVCVCVFYALICILSILLSNFLSAITEASVASAEHYDDSSLAGPSEPKKEEKPVQVVAPQTRIGHILNTPKEIKEEKEEKEEEEEKDANFSIIKKLKGEGKLHTVKKKLRMDLDFLKY